MEELTRILQSASDSRTLISAELLPLVYDELRGLAQRRMATVPPGETLQATALVHEAWLKISGDEGRPWDGRAHFFRATDGHPDADPDFDRINNHQEFLTHTDPNSGTSLWHPSLKIDDTLLTFPNLEDRKMLLEATTDFQSWSPWNVPGNDGLPASGTSRSFPRDPIDTHRFFRFRVEEP